MKKSIGVISLGCAKNLVDTEIMLGLLFQAGYSISTSYQEADSVIINTCGFITQAKEESVEAILEAISYKKSGQVKRIIVTGCLSQRYKEELKREFPEVDMFLGVNEYNEIQGAVEGKNVLWSEKLFLPHHSHPRFLTTPPSWSYLKISEGCSHQCSFCAIPSIRGPYRSRPIDSLLEETGHLAAQGVKELNLISQDTTSYGKDLGLKDGLVKLLSTLIGVRGIEWIRILYCLPEEITEDLLEILKEEKICSYLDIPFQHANTQIIKKMRRTLDGKQALELIEKIRYKVPGITLRTSLIVGFPSEGKKEFEELRQFCRAAKFEHLGVFTYSQEEGTPAYSLGDLIPQAEKERRRNEIMEIQAEISFQKNREKIEREEEALVEGKLKDKENEYAGRLRSQAPEVDGIVYIESPDSFYLPQALVPIQITNAYTYDLRGRIIR